MIVTSLKSDAEVAHLATNPWIIANGVTLDQFRILLTQTDFLIFFKNTVIVTVCVVAITMVVSVLAAFSLGRMRFWGSGILATGIFLTYLVPDTLLFIPLFQIVKSARPAQFLLEHGAGLSDADGAVLHLDHDRLFPVDPEGARRGGADRRRRPHADAAQDLHPGGAARHHRRDDLRLHGIVGGLRLSHRVPLFVADQQVLTVGTVTSLIRADVYKWGMLMAGALVAAAPPLVIYAFLMDYYIAGLTAGATKG